MISLMTSKNGLIHEVRIRNAWAGRVSGCMLGKPLEQLSMRKGAAALKAYLADAEALPLRDYVPFRPDLNDAVEHPEACRGIMDRAIPDDDVNYTVISVMLLEEYGRNFTTADVGRIWLRYLPGGIVYTAEREAYVKLLERAGMRFPHGAEPKIDLEECSDNAYNDWIGAQIRADLYGWVNPGEPEIAALMAQTDARLSHRAEGVYGAVVVAAAGALVAAGLEHDKALEAAAAFVPSDSDCAAAVHLGLATAQDATPAKIQATYEGMSPVHTVNNLALVTWGLVRNPDDFGAAIGDTVSGGWDTDCNGATVGALWGLTGKEVPAPWIGQWSDVIQTSLAGSSSFSLQELTDRTVALID